MTMTVDRPLNVLLTILMLPGRILEEGLHALAALPWAEWVVVELRPDAGTAETKVRFREGTPQWAVRLAHLLPEVIGISAGVAVLVYWFVAGPIWLPATTLDWILLSLLGAQWLAVAIPSAADADQSPERNADGGGA